jgi:regulator of ribonuclease activity A
VQFKTTDLCDQFSHQVQVLRPGLRSFGGRLRFAGPVSTVKCFEDNSRVKEAVAEPGDGRVLVVDAGGSLRCAVLGDLLARQAADNGWAGLVIHGCIRDSADIAGFDLGVWALATTPLRSQRKNEGQRDLPVEIAGARVAPGNWLYADADGIIVSAGPLL